MAGSFEVPQQELTIGLSVSGGGPNPSDDSFVLFINGRRVEHYADRTHAAQHIAEALVALMNTMTGRPR